MPTASSRPVRRRLDPRDVQVPDVRITAAWNEDEWHLLVESMRARGQLFPIRCMQIGDQVVLVDGLNRLRAAIELQWRQIDAEVVTGTEEDLMAENLISGVLKGKSRPSEELKMVAYMTNVQGSDSDAIRARTGWTRERIERLQVVAGANPDVVAAVDDGTLPLGHAYEMARYLTHDEQGRLLPMCRQFRWKVGYLREIVADTVAARPTGDTPAATAPLPFRPQPVATCTYCGGQYPPGALSAATHCQSCAADLYEIQRQRRLAGAAE